MENEYGICRVSVSYLRATPSDKAEIVSQLLFGEHVEIIEKTERWWRIKNAYDGYEGWLDFRQLVWISKAQFVDLQSCKLLAPLSFDNVLMGEDGSSYHLSPGSNIAFLKDDYCFIGEQKFKLGFVPHDSVSVDFKSNIETTAKFFLNVPYLWGGRHLFGIDCSGFVQTVFKMLGKKINRDASQQADQGKLVGFLAAAQLGDLAFFDNEEGKITHVGLMLSNNQIIHSSGKVRIDAIDDQGIYNVEQGRYTHKLRIIKRFI